MKALIVSLLAGALFAAGCSTPSTVSPVEKQIVDSAVKSPVSNRYRNVMLKSPLGELVGMGTVTVDPATPLITVAHAFKDSILWQRLVIDELPLSDLNLGEDVGIAKISTDGSQMCLADLPLCNDVVICEIGKPTAIRGYYRVPANLGLTKEPGKLPMFVNTNFTVTNLLDGSKHQVIATALSTSPISIWFIEADYPEGYSGCGFIDSDGRLYILSANVLNKNLLPWVRSDERVTILVGPIPVK